MSTTLTVRTDDDLDRDLRRLARAEGTTLSELVRSILEDAVRERTLSQRSGHLAGRLTGAAPDSDAWRAQIRERNWRS